MRPSWFRVAGYPAAARRDRHIAETGHPCGVTISAMKAWVRIGETLHVLSLAVWLGTIMMTGVAAAIIFPEMRRLDPSLAIYSKYTGDHWLLAAGHIAAMLTTHQVSAQS